MMAALKVKALIPAEADAIDRMIAESYGIRSLLSICNELLIRGNLTRNLEGDMAELLYRAIESEKRISIFLEEQSFAIAHDQASKLQKREAA